MELGPFQDSIRLIEYKEDDGYKHIASYSWINGVKEGRVF